MKPVSAVLSLATMLAFTTSAALADPPARKAKKKPAPSTASQPSQKAPTLASLEDEINDRLSLADDYRDQGISPQEISEVKELLAMQYPDGPEGANLKARVYIELSRIYERQGISPMAIKLLQDGIVDLGGYRDAEIALREGLIDIYRDLGFAPQAIREHKRIRQLRQRTTERT